MKSVEPRVFLIAETTMLRPNLKAMLSAIGADVAEKWYNETSKRLSTDGEYLIEVAGRTCYKSFGVGINPNITKIRKDSKEYFENILGKGDGSILEHSTCTFAFVNVSRVFTHELVRHRAGTAVSQESQRYVRLSSLPFWFPEEIDTNEVKKIIESLEHSYTDLERKIDWSKMNFDSKKRYTSAIRRILPQGVATNIIWTANHRTIRHVITMRTHESAEIEIRIVFDKVARIVKKRFPLIYQDFEETRLEDGTWKWRPKYVKI